MSRGCCCSRTGSDVPNSRAGQRRRPGRSRIAMAHRKSAARLVHVARDRFPDGLPPDRSPAVSAILVAISLLLAPRSAACNDPRDRVLRDWPRAWTGTTLTFPVADQPDPVGRPSPFNSGQRTPPRIPRPRIHRLQRRVLRSRGWVALRWNDIAEALVIAAGTAAILSLISRSAATVAVPLIAQLRIGACAPSRHLVSFTGGSVIAVAM